MSLHLGGHLDSKMCGSHAIMTCNRNNFFRSGEIFCSTRSGARGLGTSRARSKRLEAAYKTAPLSAGSRGSLGDKMSQKAATTAVDGHQSKTGTGSKSKGRQPTKTGPVSEEELKRQQYISPEDVLRLERATEGKDRQPARCACSDPPLVAPRVPC